MKYLAKSTDIHAVFGNSPNIRGDMMLLLKDYGNS
jgi:hypothetical protein